MEANNTVQDPVVPLSTLTETLIPILNRELVPHLDDMKQQLNTRMDSLNTIVSTMNEHVGSSIESLSCRMVAM